MKPTEQTDTDTTGDVIGDAVATAAVPSDDEFVVHDPRPIPAHLYGEWRAGSRGGPSEPEREEGEIGTAARAA